MECEGGYRAPSHSIKRNNGAAVIYEGITRDPRTRFRSTYYTNILDVTRQTLPPARSPYLAQVRSPRLRKSRD